MALGGNTGKNKGGRPKCRIAGARVQVLRAQGRSWRQIARELGIGTATAMRLCRLDATGNPSQNPVGAS